MNAAQGRFVEGVYALLEGAGITFDTVQAQAVGMGLGTLIASYTAAITRGQEPGTPPWTAAPTSRAPQKG